MPGCCSRTGDETGFVYDSMYLSAFIPHWTGRGLIGGPINLYNDRHHFGKFHSGKLLKKEIQALTDEAIRNYFQLYNIGAVVAFYPASVQRLRAVPGLVTLERRVGPVHPMRVNQPLGWFFQGEGKVKAGLNRLYLSELKGKRLSSSITGLKDFRQARPRKSCRSRISDDPIPFIKIMGPADTLTLRAWLVIEFRGTTPSLPAGPLAVPSFFMSLRASLIVLEGLLFFALQRQQLSQALVSSGKVSADPDSLFKRFRRVVIAPLGGIKATQGIVGFRRFGRESGSY